MAEPHPNVVKFTRIVNAFNENDFDTIKALVSEDCRYFVAGGGMLAGEYKGRSAFAEFLRKARAETKDVIAIELKVMTANDDHVMTYGVVRAGVLVVSDLARGVGVPYNSRMERTSSARRSSGRSAHSERVARMEGCHRRGLS